MHLLLFLLLLNEGEVTAVNKNEEEVTAVNENEGEVIEMKGK